MMSSYRYPLGVVLAACVLGLGEVGSAQCQSSTAQLSVARYHLQSSTSLHNWVFLGGGRSATGVGGATKAVDIYDACADSWAPHTFSETHEQGTATSGCDQAFFAGGTTTGGNTCTAVVDIYDSTVGQPNDPAAWSVASLFTARRNLGSTFIGSWAIFAGGLDSSSNYRDDVDIYDCSTGTWHHNPVQLSNQRHSVQGVTVGDYALFIGGKTSNGASARVDYYDMSLGLPPTNPAAWNSCSILPTARYHFGIGVVGTKVLVAGGITSGSSTATDIVEIYDLALGTPCNPAAWITAQSLSAARCSFAAATAGCRVFFAGGYDGIAPTNTSLADVDVYNDCDGSWSTLLLSKDRGVLGAGAACGVAVFGGGGQGSPTSSTAVADVDIFHDCPPINYCPATVNSSGLPGRIAAVGSTSVSANNFTLTASDCPANQFGLFFYGPLRKDVPWGNGYLCVGPGGPGNPSLYRLSPALMTDATGAASRWVDFTAPPASSGLGAILPGTCWNFQFWFRDPPAGGAFFNTTDGLCVTFCP